MNAERVDANIPSERDQIHAAIMRLPDYCGNHKEPNYGKLFLVKLLDKEGEEAFLKFLDKVLFCQSQSVELSTSDFSKQEKALLDSVHTGVVMPRRRDFLAIVGAGWCASVGGKRLWDKTAGNAPENEKTLGSRALSAGLLTVGAYGGYLLMTDGLNERRLQSIADAINVYAHEKKKRGTLVR